VSSKASPPPQTCPSAPCEPGATLLGVVDSSDTVGYLTPPIVIDEEFVSRARQGRSPEKRFRFAAPCVEAGCQQWTGSRCGVIDTVLENAAELDAERMRDSPAPCAIRPSCRWFAQSGPSACAVCPLVITDCQ
jgi:hypothetical protein